MKLGEEKFVLDADREKGEIKLLTVDTNPDDMVSIIDIYHIHS